MFETPSIPTPIIPEEEPPAPMPDPEDEVQRKRKARAAAQKRTSGQASTIMSDSEGSETLGG